MVDPQPEGKFFSVECGYVTLTAAADRLSNRFSRSGWERVRKPQVQRAKNWSRPLRRRGALFGEVFAFRKGDSRSETASCREGAWKTRTIDTRFDGKRDGKDRAEKCRGTIEFATFLSLSYYRFAPILVPSLFPFFCGFLFQLVSALPSQRSISPIRIHEGNKSITSNYKKLSADQIRDSGVLITI